MASPFDESAVSIYGQYSQYEDAGSSAPTGSSRALAFLFASSSSGDAGDTKLYLVNGTGSVSAVATEGAFNFTVAGDSGASQTITDGNTLTMAGGDGMASVASATDTVTFKVDIQNASALASVADADTMLVDDGDAGVIRKITRANYLGSALAAFSNGMTTTTLSATGDVDLGNATSDTITATGRFDSDLVPSSDDARDLGASGLEWKDLYVDGVAYVDELQADQLGAALDANSQAITNINVDSGAIDGTTIGAASQSSVRATTLSGSSTLDVDGAAQFNSSLTVKSGQTLAADSVNIDGGNIDGTTIGAASAANGTFLAVAGTTADFSSNVSVDGQADLNGDVNLGDAATDSITFVGRADSDLLPIIDSAHDLGSSALQWAELHVDTGNIDQLGSALDANSQNITGAGNLYGSAVSGSVSVSGGAAEFVSMDLNGNLDMSTGAYDLLMPDNEASALEIKEGGNVYMAFRTSNAAEGIFAGKAFMPQADGTLDLGASSLQWKDLYVHGAAYIDQLGEALDANSQNITGAGNLYGSAVSGSATVQGGAATFASIGAFTATGAIDFDSQNMTNVDIDSGAIDGTTIGAASAAAGTFTDLVAGGNVDLGDATSDTITATGRFDSDLTPSTDNARDLGAAALRYAQAHVVELHADTLGQALDANSQDITGAAAMQANNVSGSVTVQGGAATFASAVLATVSVSDLTDNRVVIAGASGELEDDSKFTYDGTTITLGDNVALGSGASDLVAFNGSLSTDIVPNADNSRDLGSGAARYAQAHVVEAHIDQLGQAMDANSMAITNINVDSGNIDGTAIGAASASTAAFTTVGVAGASPSGDVALALPSGKDAKARAFITYSERSLKTNIQPMANALETVQKMQGVTYDLKNGGKNEVGFIADEMAQIVPEVCQFETDGTAAGLDYGRLTSVLVEAIKAQQAQIEELQGKLN